MHVCVIGLSGVYVLILSVVLGSWAVVGEICSVITVQLSANRHCL